MFAVNKTWVEHPGSFIKDELEAREWTQLDLAYVLGCTVQSVNQLVNGKKGITPVMAKSLAKAFSLSPEFLSNLQKTYDLANTQEPSSDISERAALQQYPLSLMISRGWIETQKDVSLMREQLCRFFNVEKISETPSISHSAKKTSYEGIPVEQLVWLFRVRQIAQSISTENFSPKNMPSLIANLKSLRNEPEQVRHAPRLLAEAGIKFVVVEALPKSKIDGVCFWLDNKAPVIGMTTRFDRIDNFWFVLGHELEHIVHGHGKESVIIDIELEKDRSEVAEEERIADIGGAELCVDQKSMNSFYLRKAPYISEVDVLAFASLRDVHPGIVVGQIHRRTKRYSYLRKHLVNIRGHLALGAMVDGWGDVVPTEI